MTRRVAVVGGGIAGVAAAYSAAQHGASVHVFDAAPGATALAGGAVDERPWSQLLSAARLLDVPPRLATVAADLRQFSEALGLWCLAADHSPLLWLATAAGVLRPSAGCDRALMDLGQLSSGARVVVPRAMRSEWDADLLVRGLRSAANELGRNLRFDAIDADLLFRSAERTMRGLEFAALHNVPERCDWLGERLAVALRRCGGADALLVGPWLGTTTACCRRLRKQLAVPVGEVLAPLGGAAGLRFEWAREQLLDRHGVAFHGRRVERLRREAGEWQLFASGQPPAFFDAVVLAVGGLASGGLVYEPAEHAAGADLPARAREPFRLSLTLESSDASEPMAITVSALGKRIDVGGSMHGLDLETHAWPRFERPGLLEAVGIEPTAGLCAAGIHLAGEVVADRSRTILSAAAAGLGAGRAAAN